MTLAAGLVAERTFQIGGAAELAVMGFRQSRQSHVAASCALAQFKLLVSQRTHEPCPTCPFASISTP
jgi:hypothetical protein